MGSIFSIIAIPLGWVMKFIYTNVGNYGVTLILFTLFTKVILFPLAIKQKKSMIKMNAFNPIIQELNKKYANDKEKLQEEMARLQSEHGFSMTAGCLPMLIQMPILFGLIDVIYNPLKHLASISVDVVNSLKPVAESLVGELPRTSADTAIIKAIQIAPEKFAELLSPETLEFIQNMNLSFLGMDLSGTPSLKVFNLLLIIPFLSVSTMLIQQYLMTKLSGQQQTGATKMIPLYTGAMFLYFSFSFPAGVSVYWIFSNVFGIIQELILKVFINAEKMKADIEEEVAAARKEMKNSKRAAPKKVAPKSKYNDSVTEEISELAKQRLAKARELDKEKYGE